MNDVRDARKAGRLHILKRPVRGLFLGFAHAQRLFQQYQLFYSWMFGVARRVLSDKLWATLSGMLIFSFAIWIIWFFGVRPTFDQPAVVVPDPANAAASSSPDWIDQIYLTLALVTLDGNWTVNHNYPEMQGQEIGLRLNIARFLLPLLAVSSFFLILFQRSGDVIQLHLMPRRRHTVVCGLGEAGYAFVQHWCTLRRMTRNGPIVVIECDPKNPHIQFCREHGIPVIVGDVTKLRVLRRAKVRRARRIVSLLPNDGADIEFTIHIQRFIDMGIRAALRRFFVRLLRFDALLAAVNLPPRDPILIAQIDSPQLARRLDYYGRIARISRLDVRFHNIYKVMANLLLLRHPPEYYADLFGVEQPHFIVYGFGHLGQQVVTEAIRQGQYRNAKPPQFTIVDKDADKVRSFLATEFPGIQQAQEDRAISVAGFRVVEHEFKNPGVTQEDLAAITLPNETPTQHVVCFEGDEFSLCFSLSLQTRLYEHARYNAPIFVRATSRRGMAALLDANREDAEDLVDPYHILIPGIRKGLAKRAYRDEMHAEIPDGIFAFGTVEDAVSPETMDNDYIEALAEAIHAFGYFRWNKNSSLPASEEWHRLADVFRRTNRHAAMHLDIKLRAVGRRRIVARPENLERVGTESAPDALAGNSTAVAGPVRSYIDFSDEEKEILAHLEHRRYCASRLAAVWRNAEERYDPACRHKLFIPYSRADHAEMNLPHIEILPQILGADTKIIAGADSTRLDQAEAKVAHFRKTRGYHFAKVLNIGVIQMTSDFHVGRYHDVDLDTYAPILKALTKKAEKKAVTIHSPGIYFAEQAIVEALHAKLKASRPEDRSKAIEIPERDDVSIVLPMPYGAIEHTIEGLLKKDSRGPEPPGDILARWQKAIQKLVGYDYVNYVEMPMGSSFHQLARPENRQAQFDATWDYLVARCEALVLIYPEGEGECLYHVISDGQLSSSQLSSVDTGYRTLPARRMAIKNDQYFPAIRDKDRRAWPVRIAVHDAPIRPRMWETGKYRFTVGITGHRNLPDPEGVRMAIEQVLDKAEAWVFLDTVHGPDRARTAVTPRSLEWVAVSPLASGADQRFAEAILGRKRESPVVKSRLHVQLPFDFAIYEKDFQGTALDQFNELYKKANSDAVSWPMAKWSEAARIYGGGYSYTQEKEHGYRRVGEDVVTQSDFVIAVWDGARPPGIAAEDACGTWAIVAHAQRVGKPVLWIDALDPLGNPPQWLGPDGLTLASLLRKLADARV